MAKNIPISSVEGLRQELDSIVAVEHRYANVPAMILAAAQATQEAGELIQVADATADPNVVTGLAYYDYTGAATEDLGDYFLVSAPESAALSNGVGTSANGTAVDLASASNISYDIEWVRVNGDNNFGSLLKNSEAGNYYQNFVTKIRNEHIARVDIAYMRSIDNANLIGASIHSDPTGFLVVSNSVAGYDFHGLKYLADYPLIDWASDELLIPHQKRVRQIMVDEGVAFVLTDGSGTTANGSAVDLGGTLNSDIEVKRLNGDAKLALGINTANAILYYQDLVAGITSAMWADGNFVMFQSLGPGGLGANLYTEKDGYVKTGNNGTSTFKGFRYKDASSVASIDWLTDPNAGLLIPSQDRIRELATEEGWDSAPLETFQLLTITDANKTDAFVIGANVNRLEITLDAALTSDWKPASITGWIKGRIFEWDIIKKSDNGVDLSDARANGNVGYDDDKDPFANLIDITTTQQRASITAKGYSTTFGQFGRLILTDSTYVEV